MQRLGDVNASEAASIRAEPLPVKSTEPRKPDDYFAEYVKNALLRDPRLGETAQERYRAVFQGGLAIHTTLDPKLQAIATFEWPSNFPTPATGSTPSLVAVEPTSGAVRALVGGSRLRTVPVQPRHRRHRSPARFVVQGLHPGCRVRGGLRTPRHHRRLLAVSRRHPRAEALLARQLRRFPRRNDQLDEPDGAVDELRVHPPFPDRGPRQGGGGGPPDGHPVEGADRSDPVDAAWEQGGAPARHGVGLRHARGRRCVPPALFHPKRRGHGRQDNLRCRSEGRAGDLRAGRRG